jgi:hypothetical protein
VKDTCLFVCLFRSFLVCLFVARYTSSINATSCTPRVNPLGYSRIHFRGLQYIYIYHLLNHYVLSFHVGQSTNYLEADDALDAYEEKMEATRAQKSSAVDLGMDLEAMFLRMCEKNI